MFYHLLFLSYAEQPGTGGIRDLVGENPAVFTGSVAWASVGWIGVQIFFVISGFVILMSAQRKSASEFVVGRISRIAPALWFFSLLSALVVLMSGVLPLGEVMLRLVRSVTLFPIGPWLDGAVWTLVAEAVFYVGIFALIKTGRLDRITAVSTTLTAFNVILWASVLAGDLGFLGDGGRMLAEFSSSYKPRVMLVTTNCFFLVGISLYQIFRHQDVRTNIVLYAANFAACLVSAFYSARVTLGVVEFGQNAATPAIVWGVTTLTMSACVLLRLGSSPVFGRFATVAGLLTYPLYLVNQITGGAILGAAYRAGLTPIFAVITTAALCTGFAGLFAVMIERRMQTRLSQFLKRFTRAVTVPQEA